MGFPEQLKDARLKKGYTQQQVADEMGITKSTYCGYETGKRKPDVFKLRQLTKVLNISGDVLLETGINEKFSNSNNNFTTREKIDTLLNTLDNSQLSSVLTFLTYLTNINGN